MNLRAYQQEALGNTLAAFEDGAKSVLAVMATGLGKTVMFAHLAKAFLPKGRVMVIAHREELIEQARQKLQQIALVPVDVEMAEQRADEGGMFGDKAPIIVSSVQTQSRGRMERFDPEEFSLLIIDEAHHAVADTYLKTMRWYATNPNLKIFGCTATPDRADEEALGKIFEQCSYEYEITPAIADGWLVDVRRRSVIVEDLDFSGIHTVAGDLNQGELEAEMTKFRVLHGVADAALKEAGERQTICFACSVAHAAKLCEILNRHKPESAEFICGETDKDERRQLVRRFRDGEYQFLTNVGVATEGFDVPSASCIVMGRPTKSRALYAQMLGRATRPLAGVVDGCADDPIARREAIKASAKADMLVVDFTGNSGKHQLVSAVDVLGAPFNPDLLIDVDRLMKDGSMPFQEAIEEANRLRDERRAAREAAKASAAESKKIYQTRSGQMRGVRAVAEYSVVEIDASDPFDVLNIPKREPRGWDRSAGPSQKQVAFLERQGIGNAASMRKGEAGQLIDKIMRRWNDGRCTFKQARLLAKFKVDAADMTMEQAKAAIDEIAANGWKRPE